MACVLGTCGKGDYRVTINDRTGPTLLELDFEQLSWERALDTVTKATVTLPPGCCDQLTDVRPWRHELHISREGEEVWCGPIMVPANCRSGTTIEALDMLAWLDVRIVRTYHCWDASCGGTEIGSVQVAERLIRDGLEPDDPNLLKHMTTYEEGVFAGREYLVNSKTVLAALTDLAKGAIDFTAVGRRIIVMPEGHQLGRTTFLTCQHFQGDVCTSDDGYAAATRAVVTGDKDAGIVGEAGGKDPYYGLIERLVEDTQIKRPLTATEQARSIVSGSNPPPLLVQPPDGSSLSPKAPVCLSELVPGVTVPVSLDCTCRGSTQDLRLTKLKVTVDARGETVAPLLTPVGLAAFA